MSLLALVTVLPVAYWPSFQDCFPLAKLLVLLFFGAAAVFWGRLSGLHPAHVWVPLWVVWMGLSAVCSSMWPWRALPEVLVLVVPVLAGAEGMSAAMLKRFTLALVGVASLIAVYALWQAVGGEPAEAWISPFHKGVAGTIGNPDLLGGFFVIPFGLALARSLERGAGMLWRLAAALSGLAILASEARAAWIGGACVIVCLLPGASARLKAVAVGLVLIGAAAVFLPEARARLLSTSAVKERLWTWDMAARSARAAPILGKGVGSFRRVYLEGQSQARDRGRNFYHYSEYAHLEPLHVMVETGVIGLGLLSWGILCAFKLARRSVLRRADPVLGRGIEAGAAGFLAISAFSFPLHVPPSAAPFWVTLMAGGVPRGPARARHLPRDLAAVALMILILVPALRLGSASVFLRRGQIMAQAGDLEAAQAAYATGVRLNPGDVRLAWYAGSTARRRGRPAEALEWLDGGLKLEPDFCELHQERGQALKETGRLAEAEDAYRAALRVNPDFAHAWNNLGNLLGSRGRLQEAEAAQRRALELMPESAEARRNLALTLLRLGRDEEARQVLGGGR